MITSERQYAVSKKQAARFQETLDQSQAARSEIHPKAPRAMREGIESQLQDLLGEIAAYERLRGQGGEVSSRSVRVEEARFR